MQKGRKQLLKVLITIKLKVKQPMPISAVKDNGNKILVKCGNNSDTGIEEKRTITDE